MSNINIDKISTFGIIIGMDKAGKRNSRVRVRVAVLELGQGLRLKHAAVFAFALAIYATTILLVLQSN